MKKYISTLILFFVFFINAISQITPVTGVSGTFGVNQSQYMDQMRIQYNINTNSSQCIQFNLTYCLEAGYDYVQVYECDDNFSSWVFLGSTYTDVGTVQFRTNKPNGKAVLIFISDGSVSGTNGLTGFSVAYQSIAPLITNPDASSVQNNFNIQGQVKLEAYNASIPNLSIIDYTDKNMGKVNSVTTDYTKSMLLLKSGNYQLGLGMNKISSNGYLGISATQIYYTAYSHTFANIYHSDAFIIDNIGIHANARMYFGNHVLFDSNAGDGCLYYGNGGSGDLWIRTTPVRGNLSNYGEVMIIKNNGNVGIGTTAPGDKLDVIGNSVFGNLTERISMGSGSLGFNRQISTGKIYTSDAYAYQFQHNGSITNSSDYLALQVYQPGGGQITGKALVINGLGNVGIGTTTPSTNFEVIGNISFGDYSDNTYAKLIIKGPNAPTNSDSKRDISYEFAGAGKAIIRAYRGGSWDTYLQFLTSSNENTGGEPFVRMHIEGNGNVLIGKTTQSNISYKLDVNGIIHAREVKVDNNNWPDFVFTPTYKLRPLREVESFIKANGHLPEVPKATDVQQNGVNLGEMQTKLLQKVEELTIYAIEQDKKIAEQERKNIELQQEIKELKELVLKKLK